MWDYLWRSVMPKYYVQSGDLQTITTASDPRGAAIWAVHRVLSHALPFLRDEVEGGPLPRSAAAALGAEVSVSEQGFDTDAARSFDTLEIIGEWNALLVAI